MTTYLVDANVLSEAARPRPEPRVVAWLRQHEADSAVDPVILGEVRFGILLLPAGHKHRRLEDGFDTGLGRLRCLPWNAATGLRWAELLAGLRRAGRMMPVKDSLIAATALTHGLTVVMRNEADFVPAGVRLVNPFTSPWSASSAWTAHLPPHPSHDDPRPWPGGGPCPAGPARPGTGGGGGVRAFLPGGGAMGARAARLLLV